MNTDGPVPAKNAACPRTQRVPPYCQGESLVSGLFYASPAPTCKQVTVCAGVPSGEAQRGPSDRPQAPI